MADSLEIAERISGDGMPLGNDLSLPIRKTQVDIPTNEAKPIGWDDDAAGTIAWMDYQSAQMWLDTNSWLAEWQYVDYLYQSPNYDRGDWRTSTRPARISRFLVAKNRNTMSNQVRRGLFGDSNPFILEPRGKLAESENSEKILDAWTEIFNVLNDRANFEYNLTLAIECQVFFREQ